MLLCFVAPRLRPDLFCNAVFHAVLPFARRFDHSAHCPPNKTVSCWPWHRRKILPRPIPFDIAMIAARAHVELGQFEKAQTSATRAQALAPKLAAPRILKAFVLHGRKPRRAMFQRRRALDLSTERNERITATRLLRQIQAGLTVKISGGLGIAPSSNINKISYSTTHASINPLTGTLQTIPWTANEPQRSGSGLRLWNGLSYVLPKTQLSTQLASLNLSTDVYNEPRFNRSSLSINHKLVFTPTAQHQTTLTQAFTAVHQFNALESRIFSSSWSRLLCASRSPKPPTNCPARLVPRRRYHHAPRWQRQPGAENQLAPLLAHQLIQPI